MGRLRGCSLEQSTSIIMRINAGVPDTNGRFFEIAPYTSSLETATLINEMPKKGDSANLPSNIKTELLLVTVRQFADNPYSPILTLCRRSDYGLSEDMRMFFSYLQ